MKILNNSKTGRKGTVILQIMCIVALAGMVLGSFFMIVQNQSASVSRTQAWNTAVVASEAGIEDAFGLINETLAGVGASGWEWTNNVGLVNNGWGVMTTNSTTLTRTIGSISYQVSVTIPAGSTNPIIESVGFVPHTTYPWVFGAGGVSQVFTTTLARKIHVGTTRAGLFPVAIASQQPIKIAGGTLVDSYDSSNPLYSTGGLYDPAKSRDNATVATDANVQKSIVGTGNIQIKGSVVTGPGGTATLSGIATVGDSAWVSGGSSGIQSGHSRDDMNVDFLDAKAPKLSWQPPTSTNINGTNITMMSGNDTAYQMLSISGGNILITGQNVTLYVPGDIKMTSSSSIVLGAGASVKVFVGGNADMAGQGVVNPGNPLNFQLYGLPTCTSISYSGGSSFTGTIYAPEADVSLSGGASFYGATVSKSFTSNGGANFHYDENLATAGPQGPFLATGWQEVKYP